MRQTAFFGHNNILLEANIRYDNQIEISKSQPAVSTCILKLEFSLHEL